MGNLQLGLAGPRLMDRRMTTTWIPIGRNEDFPVGLHEVKAGETRIVVAVLEGEVFAFHPHCPHMAGPLNLSEVEGAIIACPLHGWRFDLRDNGREIHGFRSVKTYDVKVEHGAISIGLD
jgi:nitrite reductase (NADH) small subunit